MFHSCTYLLIFLSLLFSKLISAVYDSPRCQCTEHRGLRGRGLPCSGLAREIRGYTMVELLLSFKCCIFENISLLFGRQRNDSFLHQRSYAKLVWRSCVTSTSSTDPSILLVPVKRDAGKYPIKKYFVYPLVQAVQGFKLLVYGHVCVCAMASRTTCCTLQRENKQPSTVFPN
jgi:hypothetical protein